MRYPLLHKTGMFTGVLFSRQMFIGKKTKQNLLKDDTQIRDAFHILKKGKQFNCRVCITSISTLNVSIH